MRKIAETTNYGLYLNDDDTETFLSWRNKLNGDTGTSNMDLIDTALNDNSTAIESVKSDLSEHVNDGEAHFAENEHIEVLDHLADGNIHVTAEDKETWDSTGFVWNLLHDTRMMESWTRSNETYITLEEDDDGFNVATFAASDSTLTRNICGGFVPYEDIAGQECTISFMARSDDADSITVGSDGIRITLQVNEPDTIDTTLGTETYDMTSEQLSTEWTKYSYTFTYSSDAATSTSEVNFQFNNYSYYTLEIKQAKLEPGDTATEWISHISEYNDSSTADALTTAVDLSVDLASTGTISFDGSASVAIPIASDSSPLPIEYGGTGGATNTDAIVNLFYTDVDSTDFATGQRVSVFDSSAAYSMRTSKLPNSILAESSEVTSTELSDYSSYYMPLAAGSTDDTNCYKVSPDSMLTWVGDNIFTGGLVDLTSDVTNILPIANGGTGNSTGIALYATQLETTRTIQTDLTSTDAVGFDGSANVTPGVTGILPIDNGGTGANTAADALYNILYDSTEVDPTGIADTDYIGLLNSTDETGSKLSIANLKMYLESALDISSDSTIDLTTDVTDILPVANGGTGYGTTAGALYNIGYNGGTTAYYLAPSSYYVPFVGANSDYSKKMSLSRLINSAVAGGTDVSSTLSSYTSYYLPFVSGTATNSSSSANGTYKFTLTGLMDYISDNVGSDYEIVVGTYDGEQSYSDTTYQSVAIGGRPELVMVFGQDAIENYGAYWWYDKTDAVSRTYGAVAMYGYEPVSGDSLSILYTYSSGFRVRNDYNSDGRWLLNLSGYTYIYFALL